MKLRNFIFVWCTIILLAAPIPKVKRNVISRFVTGVGDGASSIITGLINVKAHPVETTKNLGHLVAHPIESVKAIVSGGSGTWKKDKAHALGYNFVVLK